MDRYYDLVRRARDLLAADGFDSASREVWEAERSAGTSGEAISEICVVLRLALSLELSEEARLAIVIALNEGDRLWNEANG